MYVVFAVVSEFVVPEEVSVVCAAGLGGPVVAHVVEEFGGDEVGVEATDGGACEFGPETVDGEGLAEWGEGD